MTGQGLVDIKVLDSFRFTEVDGKFKYQNITKRVAEYSKYKEEVLVPLQREISGKPLLERLVHKHLSSVDLILTGDKLIHSNSADTGIELAKKFTTLSMDVYGSIDAEIAKKILRLQTKAFHKNQTPDAGLKELLQNYDSIVSKLDSSEVQYKGKLFPRIDLPDSKIELDKIYSYLKCSTVRARYNSAQIFEEFSKALEKMKKHMPEMSEWSVVFIEKGAVLYVDSTEKQIVVPRFRRDVIGIDELQALIYHEIGVHALRSQVPKNSIDLYLVDGFPDYAAFEEGLGVFAEYISYGTIPDKVFDRYLDTAIAAGYLDYTLDKIELEEFYNLRCSLRLYENPESYIGQQDETASTHIHRIFSGTNGVMYEKDGSSTQGVYTRDSSYLSGLIKVIDYFTMRVNLGDDFKSIWDFCTKASFDPTNESHAAYINESSL
jgi:hypothetical protein